MSEQTREKSAGEPVDGDALAAELAASEVAEPATGADAEETWAHFAPEPERPPRRYELAIRRVVRILTHEWTLVVLGALGLAILMNVQCVLHPSTTIPADLGDPLLQAWQMAWAGHAVSTSPGQLWDANTFFPDQLSFAFSDTLLGYLPASLIGTGPTAAVVRYNIMFILMQALAFIGPYALVRQLGAGRIAAAVAGAAFGYAPWRWGQAGHMHVLSDGGMVLALALLARGHGYTLTDGFRRDRTRPGWAFAGWCVAAWQVSLGFGIGLPFAYLLGGAIVVVGIRWLIRASRGRPVPDRRTLLADGLGILIFGVISGLMVLPYLKVLQLHPEARRTVEDLKIFSPTLRAFVTAPAQSRLWGSAHEAARATMVAPAETTLLPGFFLIGLATAGLFFSIWSLRVRLWLLGGAVVSVMFAMGTQFFGGWFSYLPLYYLAPGWSAIRTPGRLAVWATLALAVLAAGAAGALVDRAHELAVERIPARPSLAMRAAMLLPLALVLVEGVNKIDHPVVPPVPAAFHTATGPVLVLPIEAWSDFQVMMWSTERFPKVVNGVSGFVPRSQETTREVARSFPDQASVDYLRGIGIKTVIVLKAAAGQDYAKAAAPDPSAQALGIRWQDNGDTVVYTLS